MSVWQSLNAGLAEVVVRARAALVQVRDGAGGGAGVVLHPQGLILTNAHVVRRGRPEVLSPEGRRWPARVIARDPAHDLAALAVEARGLPALEVGDSRRLRPGEWVVALGHPWGVAGAATAGVVIGVGADLPEAPRLGRGEEWIAVSLRLRPGHSGGPLVDAQGRLLGLNTVMAGPEVGLAVPVHLVTGFLRRAFEVTTRVA